MSQSAIPRIVIAGTHSGVGKTTIVTGLLASLRERGLTVQSYKIGPDYIDPGYHQLATGKTSHNLDTWLVPTDKILPIFTKTAVGNDIAVVEGVMGLYDGGRQGISSTAAISKLLKAPVILVIDARSMGESAAAIALGYKMYDHEVNVVGVIINRLGSTNHEKMVREALERINIPVLGCIYRNEALGMPERHLGLTPVVEHLTQDLLINLRTQIGKQVDVAKIIVMAQNAPALPCSAATCIAPFAWAKGVRIGVAQDEAFSFYYPESIDILAAMGAEIVPFSPLRDKELPLVHGLLLGGGFPEMFLRELSSNVSMRQSIYEASMRDMPIYGECGGLMYLTKGIMDFDGTQYDMIGAIPARCQMQSTLQTVGYVEATALKDNILLPAGDSLRGHEFHFSLMNIEETPEDFPWAFTFKKTRTGAVYPGGYAKDNLLASYLHMHFAGHEQEAETFLKNCSAFKENKK